LIGGGEPTLYPGFADFVRFMKEELGLQVSVVSNGSRNNKILEAASYLESGDWVRLSLDSARNDTFQRMHNPTPKTLTLDEICSWVPKIKGENPDFDFGYSFIITWKGAQRDDVKVVENIDEIVEAAHRARDAGFNYISYKPFLERAEDGAEIMDPAKAEEDMRRTVVRIRSLVDEAKTLERPGFRVMESTNLRMLEEDSWRDLTKQPTTCHMQALRQVLTPLGTFNCPAYRGVDHARVGEKDAYKDFVAARSTAERWRGGAAPAGLRGGKPPPCRSRRGPGAGPGGGPVYRRLLDAGATDRGRRRSLGVPLCKPPVDGLPRQSRPSGPGRPQGTGEEPAGLGGA
jgi:hypothetical protein